MPVLMPEKFKGKTIAGGERAFVQRIRGAGVPKGTIARFSLSEPGRRQEPVREMFYKYKIAHAIFPDNFVRAKAAWMTGPLAYGDVLLTQEKVLDASSRQLRRRAMDAINSSPDSEQWERFKSSPGFKRHCARVRKCAAPLAGKMRRIGIFVNKNPLNVWFDMKGNPVFFDVFFIDSFALLRSRKGQQLKGLVRLLTPQRPAAKF